MALVKINWHPGEKELRRFGLTALVGFSIIGVLFIWRGGAKEIAIASFALAAVSGLTSLLAPKTSLPIYWVLMAFAWLMGHIMSRLILFLVYYLLFTPLGFAMRLLGRDRLALKRRSDTATYWVDALPPPEEPRRYQRQF